MLTAGKLDLSFGFGRHTIAGCGSVPPAANRLQDIPVSRGTSALKNDGTMHAAIRADDEAYLYLHTRSGQNQ